MMMDGAGSRTQAMVDVQLHASTYYFINTTEVRQPLHLFSWSINILWFKIKTIHPGDYPR